MKKFSISRPFVRLFALLVLILTFLLVFQKEPELSLNKDFGSFFLAQNPSDTLVGDILFSALNLAKKSVDIQIYALTDSSLIESLNQKSKTIDITLYHDASASRDLNQKISPLIKRSSYKGHGLMHRKICIIDDDINCIGSANYTTSSLFWHFNNLCVFRSKIAADFFKNYKKGCCDFELGCLFLLPDYKNEALNAVIKALKQAQVTIHLAMFSLTHPKILNELQKASDRGVKVYLYADKLNFNKMTPAFEQTIKKCEKIFTQTSQVLLHHKLCLIDQSILITGSSNWSKSGFKKNEEVLVIFDKLSPDQKSACLNLFLDLQNKLAELNIEDLAA